MVTGFFLLKVVNMPWKFFSYEKIDLVLTDIIMPEMNGYQLAAIVQKNHPLIKIQLSSGFTDDRHLEKVNDALHKNMLHKPYTSDDLLKKIRQLLDS